MYFPSLLAAALPHLDPTLLGLLLLHYTAALFLTGVYWFVQVVHYPLFRNIAPVEFSGYYLRNICATRWVVLPGAAAEIITWLLLACLWPALFSNFVFASSSVLLAGLWLWTFMDTFPSHWRLRREGNTRSLVASTIRSSWVRTILSTMRCVLLGSLLMEVLRSAGQ